MQRLGFCLLIALAILSVDAHAQADWIDEFPSVTVVAHAAFEELKVTSAQSKLDMTHDDDSIAVNLAGTLLVLREIMYLKYIAEQPMPKEREDKLKKLVATYLEAELTIGRGAGTRRGYITRAPAAGGQGCRALDQECYRRWFLAHLHANTSRAEYRERFLNRLFPCGGRAKELNDLRQSRAMKMPYFPSPAVTLQTDGQLAGLAPAGCTGYGGDANRNGLCDDWENVPDRDKPPSAVLRPTSASAAIRMTGVRYDYTSKPARGLKVMIAKEVVEAGSVACFRVLRADRASLGAGKPVWHGPAKIESEADKTAPLYAIVARDEEFTLDEKQPFLLAEVTSGPSYGAVHCEQTLKTWQPRHLAPALSGLHGPYKTVEVAMKVDQAGIFALNLTSENEAGYLIVRNTRLTDGGSDSYFVTPPTRSSQGLAARLLQPLLQPEDYYSSFKAGFERSCEDPAVFKVAATVHTHPITAGNRQISNFSTKDIDGALLFVPARPMQFGEGNLLDTDLELIFMIDAFDRCIRAFDPRLGGDLNTNPVRKLGCAPP